MLNNYQRTENWLAACGKTPNEVGLSVQIGCHLEEIVEFVRTLSVADQELRSTLDTAANFLDTVGNALKKQVTFAIINPLKRVDALDALCDCEVTGNGVAYMAEFDKQAGDEAVLASNEDKLVDGKPVILEGGKIGKRPGWTPPDLSNFV